MSWPSEVHTLFTQAIRASKSHNYAKTIVVNLVVFLRETIRSRTIPIYSEQELCRILPPAQSYSPTRPVQGQLDHNQVNHAILTITTQQLQNQPFQSQPFHFNSAPCAQGSVFTYSYTNYPTSST